MLSRGENDFYEACLKYFNSFLEARNKLDRYNVPIMTDGVTRVILFCQKTKLKCYADERIILLLLPRDAMLARY